jgi:hypothetical protein
MDELQVQVYGPMREHFVNSITYGLKDLFESKHLYQNLNIAFPEFQIIFDDIKNYSPVHDINHANREKFCRYIYDQVPEFQWLIKNPYGRRSFSYYVYLHASNDLHNLPLR